jgi:transposase
MAIQDARTLSPEAQEALRRRVMEAIDGGMKPAVAARTFNVSRQAIHNWKARRSRGGPDPLKSRKRGRPPRSRLAGHEAATAVRLITDRCPDQLKLPFALWTREAVRELLRDRFDVDVSIWTVGRYLARWGLTPQKPLRRAYEQDPAAVKQWLEKEYPAVARRCKQENGEIHWGDQMGLRSDHQAGRSYGRRGQTPVIPGTGKRFRCNMISTITNRGVLRFMVFTESFRYPVMVRFLRRLLKTSPRKIFLIVDRHSVHESAPVRKWIDRHRERIEMFFLPTYSPELNPDERLNHDVKANALGRQRPATKDEMVCGIRSYLQKTQKRPHKVRNYFKDKHVAYAAA